jgi:hypothetical protein
MSFGLYACRTNCQYEVLSLICRTRLRPTKRPIISHYPACAVVALRRGSLVALSPALADSASAWVSGIRLHMIARRERAQYIKARAPFGTPGLIQPLARAP